MTRLFLFGVIALAACATDRIRVAPSLATGTLRVRVGVAPGGTPDGGAMWISVGTDRAKVPASGRDLIIDGLLTGPYAVRVDSLDPWCAAIPVSDSVAILEGDTTDAQFTVVCTTVESTRRIVAQPAR